MRLARGVLVALPLALPVLCQAGWQLTWSDEFDRADGSSPDPAKWGFDVGGGGYGNNELESYTSRTNNARIQGGQLVIEAKQENYTGPDNIPRNYTSARMLTKGKWSWTYGRMEARIKIPRGQGIWPAFWTLGANINTSPWPNCGEIDIMENIGKPTEQAKVYGTIHGPQSGGDYNGGAGVGGSYTLPGPAVLGDDFHVFAIEWTTNQIKWFMDNQQYFTATPASLPGGGTWPFTQPQFLLLNVAVGGNWPGNPDGTTVFPQQMLVDYVRVYSYVASAPSTPTGLTVSPGSSKVYLNWDASSSGATGYVVKRSSSSGGPYTTVASPASNNYTDSGLANCSTYYYVVAATNSVGASTNSSEQSASLGAYALAVNSGGGAAGQFVADANVTGGTIGATVSTVIDTSGLVAPAPQAVYQAERYGNFTYTFTGLISGATYKVRLHSAETFWTAVGQRRFNVIINGTQVLTNFDIIAAAGAPNKAVISEFNAVAGSGQIVIQYITVMDNARASGIEIILAQPAAPTGLTATPGVSQVFLKWNSLAGASYDVKRATASGGPYTSVFSGLTSTNCTDTGLTNGVTYYYVVSADVLGCASTNSAFTSATPVCSPPPAPTAGNNGPIWMGMTLNLTASTVPGATYNWSGPNAFSSTNQNPSIANASTNASGLFSVTAATGGCVSIPATTMVTINPPASVTIQSQNGKVILDWPAGTLQWATNVTGPWDDILGAVPPRTNAADGPGEFYRVKLE
ncbi:MAG TPA: family 16 glycosylhydrolase [Verrucomicrobiae bacterium]|nr:family 16 glycosylhydrolase [Verrucomicrobiae bacterium]